VREHIAYALKRRCVMGTSLKIQNFDFHAFLSLRGFEMSSRTGQLESRTLASAVSHFLRADFSSVRRVCRLAILPSTEASFARSRPCILGQAFPSPLRRASSSRISSREKPSSLDKTYWIDHCFLGRAYEQKG